MPRPPDTYTHSQFEPIESDNIGDTVRCVHCKHWQGNVKTLNRKKEHLLRCPRYAQWRAEGHGQDLMPPNQYTKRDSFPAFNGPGSNESPVHEATPSQRVGGTQGTPVVASRPRTHIDFTKFYDESPDPEGALKCSRVRCQFCGYMRAKNATRQVEHLLQCRAFLDSPEGAEEMKRSGQATPGSAPPSSAPPVKDIWRGQAPNPNIMLPRGTKRTLDGGQPETPMRPFLLKKPATAPVGGSNGRAPSLVQHLLIKNQAAVDDATAHDFLFQAGNGTLTTKALGHWLVQLGHIARALIPFTGALIAKVRLPENIDLRTDSIFRALDLLCSAANNTTKELGFLEDTRTQYQLQIAHQEPWPTTKALTDLLVASTAPSASLLEGIVVLWAVEHMVVLSWKYAWSIQRSGPPHSHAYSLPSYLRGGAAGDQSHAIAAQKAFVQNWTSENFVRFVDACRAIVDELANAQTSGNGRTEMLNCERVFRQAVWLWGQTWPSVNAYGDLADDVEPADPPETAPHVLRESPAGAVRAGHEHEPSTAAQASEADVPNEDADGDREDHDETMGSSPDADAPADSPYPAAASLVGIAAQAERAS